MISTAIVFNHRNRLRADGTGPVEVRVTIERKPCYVNTGVMVRPREFKFGRVVNRADEKTLNERISAILQRVDDVVTESIGHDIDVRQIRRRVWAPDGRRKVKDAEDMLAWMKREIDQLGVRPGTASHYRVTVSRLADFGLMRRWSDLSVENIHRWDAYLHGMQKHRTDAEARVGTPVEYVSQATVRNYHKDVKALISRAVKFGIIKDNPYDRMKGEIKRGDAETIEFLTKEELSRIEALTLADGSMMAAARDMFVFQAYTGMAYGDMRAFSLDKCRRDGDKWVIAAQRVKTGVTYYVQLMTPALAVVQKYGGQLPRVAVQVYNRNLKKIAEATGITKRLTSHVGRHTFATWALHEGVQIERVSRMLGHSRITQTQRYAKVLARDVLDEFDRLEATIAGR